MSYCGKLLLCGYALALTVVPASALGQPASTGSGQAWPTKSMRVVVPFTAASATDTVARMVSERLSAQFGQNLVVENRPGAGGRPRAVNRVPACGMRTSASREACR